MSIGARVRRRRQELGWSQSELAQRAGVAVDTIRKLEQGQSKGSRKLADLAVVLGVDERELIYGDVAADRVARVDFDDADEIPADEQEMIDAVVRELGLSDAAAARLATVRRHAGGYLDRIVLLGLAESIRRNEARANSRVPLSSDQPSGAGRYRPPGKH